MPDDRSKVPNLRCRRMLEVSKSLGGEMTQRQDFAGRSVVDEVAAIVASASDAVIGVGLDDVVTSWNPAAQRMYGYSAEEIIGEKVTQLAPPDRDDPVLALRERIVREERVGHVRTDRRTKTGMLVPVSIMVSPIRDNTGQLVGLSAIDRTDTDRRTRNTATLRALLIQEFWDEPELLTLFESKIIDRN